MTSTSPREVRRSRITSAAHAVAAEGADQPAAGQLEGARRGGRATHRDAPVEPQRRIEREDLDLPAQGHAGLDAVALEPERLVTRSDELAAVQAGELRSILARHQPRRLRLAQG